MTFDEIDDVRAALEHPDLVPHGPHVDAADELDGATMRLRAAMARFTGDASHATRRAAVVALVGRIDAVVLTEAARAATIARLGGDRVDASGLARRVPTEAMAAALGITGGDDREDIGRLVDDVDAMVAVIGRGAHPSALADAATDRLLVRTAAAGHDPVAAVSVLYQTTDATAALLLARLGALALADDPVPAVPRTRRLARRDVRLGALAIAAGTEIVLEIGAAGLPFGAGPHACPGQALATALVDAIDGTATAAGYAPDPSSVELDEDGRPVAVSLVVASAR